MIKIARAEIGRRQLPLPKRYEIVIEKGFSHTEIRPRTHIFGVSFRFKYRHAIETVYIVWFDEHGALDDVTDYRSVLPLSE